MKIEDGLVRSLEEIKQLINIAEINKAEFIIVFINGDPQYTLANSGYLDQDEAEHIKDAFRLISNEEQFFFYNNPSTFVGDIMLNKINFSKNKYKLLYSTAQIGIDVNRRSFMPNFARIHDIFSITGDGHQLSLLQNKMHYYEIARNHVNVPKTLLFNGKNHNVFEEINMLSTQFYIIKPNIECAGRGVKLVKNPLFLKPEVENLYKSFQQPILIQEFKKGKEIEVPVIINEKTPIALPAVEIVKENILIDQHISDFEKYEFKIFEGQENLDAMKKAENLATILELQGLCRIDFIVDDKGMCWLFDIAAIPLISKHSSCYKTFEFLFPEDNYALYKALIGSKLIELIGPIDNIGNKP